MPADTELHKAANNGDIAKTQELVLSGEDVNAAGANMRTPLHRAASGNFSNIVQFLLDNGAIIDQTDKFGRSALHWAALSGSVACVSLLLSKGANAKLLASSRSSALHCAAENGHVDVIRIVIESIIEVERLEFVNLQDEMSKTALNLAIDAKHTNVVTLFNTMCPSDSGQAGSCLVM